MPVQFREFRADPWLWRVPQLVLEMGLDGTRAERVTVLPSSVDSSLGTRLGWGSGGAEGMAAEGQGSARVGGGAVL